MDSCEYGFMIDIPLEHVEFKRAHLLFGLEASDVQVKFKNLFRPLSLFTIRIADEFVFYFVLFLYLLSELRTHFYSIFPLSLDCCILLSGINSITRSKWLWCRNYNK